MKNKIPFAIFLLLTVSLLYAHIRAKANYKSELKGLDEIINGRGQRQSIKIDERYLVMKSKNDVKLQATIIPYTFALDGEIYEGKIAAIGKSFEELVSDSTYFLPQNPRINSVYPKDDYLRLEKEGIWNWRLYLGILMALGAIGSLMPDKK